MPKRIFHSSNMAAVSLFHSSNMAAVTSREHTLFSAINPRDQFSLGKNHTHQYVIFGAIISTVKWLSFPLQYLIQSPLLKIPQPHAALFPFTPRIGQYVNSSLNCNALSGREVSRIKSIISLRI